MTETEVKRLVTLGTLDHTSQHDNGFQFLVNARSSEHVAECEAGVN